jgi:hypothetical protein
MVDRLPHDAKALIASFLSGHQLKQLVLVSQAWRAAADSHLMSRLHVPPPSGRHQCVGESAVASWAELRQLLESQPSRISFIKEIKASGNGLLGNGASERYTANGQPVRHRMDRGVQLHGSLLAYRLPMGRFDTRLARHAAHASIEESHHTR